MSEADESQLGVLVLLAMQRALLGAVTPDLRAVVVGWDRHQIAARFVYDGDGGNPDVVSIAETEVIADISEDLNTLFTIESAVPPSPIRWREGEVWVYHRLEA